MMWVALGVLVFGVAAIAVRDLTQRRHAVTRNFPVIGHLRYFLEEMGPPLRQYFFAGDREERPYNRVTRSWVYASAKGQNNLIGFGSQVDHNEPGRMHIVPSLYPTLKSADATGADLPRPRLIGAKRAQPYQPRRFANISGMSYGALSPNAVRALSRGARMAEAYMSTGEGSLSPYHVEGGADILYQIGPAKFGCRTPDGRFDDAKAAAILALPQVKMVEIKLAQGAKPGKGGMLPKEKITREIAEIRGIPMGIDCQSPNRFEEFDDAASLLDFIERVRRLTGKPVGLKMVVGAAAEVDELCREIRQRGDGPDFIAVDGNEGGSGSAPLALADYVGLPLVDALIAVDNALRREGLRHDIALIASGKIATGGDVATHLALGADLVHIGRGFLFSIGCIQALRCHTNTCPAGVTTQNQWLQSGLDPADKGVRVGNYALALERDLQMITHACGLTHPGQLHRGHVVMNISPGVRKSLADLFPYPTTRSQPARTAWRNAPDQPVALGRTLQMETLVSK
ncbi:MAG: FMN-binding glutamate synthase family protein [Acidobacteriota bacterium]|nr:FMN-binding glutamate synthase family protein [Acidobacteriota bacterium]